MGVHDEFAGVIGRDWRDSTPAWPARPEPPDGRAQRRVRRARRRRVRAARLLRLRSSRRRTSTRSPGRACASPTSTPPRSARRRGQLPAHRPQPPHQRHGPRRRPRHRLSRATAGVVPPENGFLSEILRAHGYSTYAVGKWHLTPDDETHMAADRSSWPLGRGFDRWYGFHGGETHQFVPTLYCDNHSVQPPRTPAEGYHLTEDLVDHAIEYLSDLRNVDGEQPFFLYFATGACHSPHHAPPEWIERYRGVFDDGWDALRERILRPPDGARRRRPPTPSCRRAHRGCRRGTTSNRPTRRSRRGSWSASPASSRTPTTQIGRLLAYLEESGDADNTRGRARVRQRRQRRGWCHRLDQRRAHDQPRSRRADGDARAHRRARRSLAAQQLSVGLDDGRQHTVQAVEARGARGRRRRSVHRALAGALRRRRRWDPPPVRARDRRAADGARADRRRSARSDPRSGAEPRRRHELRVPVRGRRRRRSRPSHHAALRDARFAARSTTTAGRR